MGGRMGARRSGGLRQQRCRGEGGGILLIPSLFSLLAPAAAGRGHLLCPPPYTHCPHWVLAGMLPTQCCWLGFLSHDISPFSGSPPLASALAWVLMLTQSDPTARSPEDPRCTHCPAQPPLSPMLPYSDSKVLLGPEVA